MDDDEVHCYHPERLHDQDDWPDDDALCVHCECCCTCLGCEYGPRDGMATSEQVRDDVAATAAAMGLDVSR